MGLVMEAEALRIEGEAVSTREGVDGAGEDEGGGNPVWMASGNAVLPVAR